MLEFWFREQNAEQNGQKCWFFVKTWNFITNINSVNLTHHPNQPSFKIFIFPKTNWKSEKWRNDAFWISSMLSIVNQSLSEMAYGLLFQVISKKYFFFCFVNITGNRKSIEMHYPFSLPLSFIRIRLHQIASITITTTVNVSFHQISN